MWAYLERERWSQASRQGTSIYNVPNTTPSLSFISLQILFSQAKTKLTTPIHLEVSFASEKAINRVENAGGTVTCVHFNKLALRALIKPFKFNILPRRARPPPKIMDYYLDHTKAGYLSPEIQIRNLKLFGSVTSEESLREEHEKFMIYQRQQKQATSN